LLSPQWTCVDTYARGRGNTSACFCDVFGSSGFVSAFLDHARKRQNEQRKDGEGKWEHEEGGTRTAERLRAVYTAAPKGPYIHAHMKKSTTNLLTLFVCAFLILTAGQSHAQKPQRPVPNRLIDYPAFLKEAQEVEAIRAARRLPETQFRRMMTEPGVVLLDARSAPMFKLRHLKGAVNLSLPDFTASGLSGIIPRKDTKVLIYCNNNFLGSPVSFQSKNSAASLNISTYITLHTYGYTNVYELGPLIEINASTLPFEGDEVR
jgi:phage shock protein E